MHTLLKGSGSLLLASLLAASFLVVAGLPFSAHAVINSTKPSSDAAGVPRCTSDNECPAASSGTRSCSDFHFTDGVDAKLCTGCNNEGASACSSGVCNATTGICVPAGTDSSSPGSGSGAASGGSASSGGTSDLGTFVPLTSIPGIELAGNTSQIPALLNNLYRLCVGLAAALAVLQITRAGIIYMLQDTGITEKKEARRTLEMSVFGLLLVLSPAIVFGVIDPRILNLDISIANLHVADAPEFAVDGGGNNEAAVREAIAMAAQACGVTPTAGQRACIANITVDSGIVGNYNEADLVDCLGGVGGQDGISSDQYRCIVSQAGSSDPGTVPAAGATRQRLGTYISWKYFESVGLSDAANYQPAGPKAQEWFSSASCQNRAEKATTRCFSDGKGGCSTVFGYCTSSLVIDQARQKPVGNVFWGDWQNISSQDTSKETAFRNECSGAVLELNDTSNNRVQVAKTSYTCNRLTMSQIFPDYATNAEYECQHSTLTCDIR